MSCKLEGDVIRSIEQHVPNHQAAVDLYILAHRLAGTVETDASTRSVINSLITRVLKLKASKVNNGAQANKLLQEMARSKVMRLNGKTGYESYYVSNKCDSLAAYILDNRPVGFIIKYGKVNHDKEMGVKPYLHVDFKAGETVKSDMPKFFEHADHVEEDYSIAFEDIGRSSLGVTIVSPNIAFERQAEVVEHIAEEISRAAISSKNGKALEKSTVDEIFDKYKTMLESIVTRENDRAASATDDKVKAKALNVAAHVQEYLDNFDNLKGVVISTLKRRAGISVTNAKVKQISEEEAKTVPTEVLEDTLGVELEDGAKERSNWSDEYSISVDAKTQLSSRLRRFLSFIKSPKKNYLFANQTYEKFDKVFNTLSAILEGEDTEWDVYNGDVLVGGLKYKLQEYGDTFPWINELVGMVDQSIASGDTRIVHELITAMTKHYIPMTFTEFKSSGKTMTTKIMDSNANAQYRVVVDRWNDNISNRSKMVVVNSNGVKVYDKVALKEGVDKFTDVKAKIAEVFKNFSKPSVDLSKISNEDINTVVALVQDALVPFGIDISDKAIIAMMRGGVRFKNRTLSFKDAFGKHSNSIFTAIETSAKATIAKKVQVAYSSANRSSDWMNQGVVSHLARQEAKGSVRHLSNSHQAGSKTVWSYTNNNYFVNRIQAIQKAISGKDSTLFESLANDVFSGSSKWLSELSNQSSIAAEVFAFNYIDLNAVKDADGKASDRGITELSPKEVLLSKLANFLNNGQEVQGSRIAKMFYLTMSDKSRMFTIDRPVIDTERLWMHEDGRYSFDKSLIDMVFNHVVKSELNRMIAVKKSTNGYTVDGLNIDSYVEGSRLFYFTPELNVVSELFTKDAKGNRMIAYDSVEELEADEAVMTRVYGALNNSLGSLVKNQMAQFQEENAISIIDEKVKARVKKSTGAKTDTEILQHVAVDFGLNYFLHNADLYQMFVGDPALFYKKKDVKQALEIIETSKSGGAKILAAYNAARETFNNIGKRLAGDMAPGYEANYTIAGKSLGNGNYQYARKDFKVLTIADMQSASKSIDFIEKMFEGHPDKDSVVEAYKGIDAADAQSWSSIDFFLDTLNAFGSSYITPEQYQSMKDKVAAWKNDNCKGDIGFSRSELEVVLTPIKPVYVNNNQKKFSSDSNETIGVRHYIKTSTFPLIPELCRGTHLESVMNAVHNNGVDLVVSKSGYKVGCSNNVYDEHKNIESNGLVDIFNSDGSVNEAGLANVSKNAVTLPIKGWKIQQDVPYHDHPGTVGMGSQESKLLFNSIRHLSGFKLNGKIVTGEKLEAEYIHALDNIYREASEKLTEEIYSNGALDIEKLHKVLMDEAVSRNYSMNDILGLAITDEVNPSFKFPLWSLPSASKYESLLLSIVDNRVRKVKLPGSSFVLGSEAGFKSKTSLKDTNSEDFKRHQDRIVYTSHYDHEKGLQAFRENKDGSIGMAQVFVPMKLKGAHGGFIDVMKYTKRQNGRLVLDEDRLPKELLKIFGFRIPTQGHNSMAGIEIAGFLPQAAGDLVIATQDFVKQMGSDKR